MVEIDELAKILWDYNRMGHKLVPGDAIIALGSMDGRVAERAAELWHQKLAPTIIVAGGFGRLTGTDTSMSEAAKFRTILLDKNVRESSILTEDKSTNTAENLTYAIKMLKERSPTASSVIIVTKPYAERRIYATFKKLYPEYGVRLTSPVLTYEQYPHGEITKNLMINIIVGDTQRTMEYPARGFTIPQKLPNKVEVAMNKLIELGFDQQLIK